MSHDEYLIRTRERLLSVCLSALLGLTIIVAMGALVQVFIYALFGHTSVAVMWVTVGIAGFAAFAFGSMGWTDPPWGGKTFQALQWEREARSQDSKPQ